MKNFLLQIESNKYFMAENFSSELHQITSRLIFCACHRLKQNLCPSTLSNHFSCSIFHASALIGFGSGEFYANIKIGVKKFLSSCHVNFNVELRHLQPFRFVTLTTTTMSLFALRLMQCKCSNFMEICQF